MKKLILETLLHLLEKEYERTTESQYGEDNDWKMGTLAEDQMRESYLIAKIKTTLGKL